MTADQMREVMSADEFDDWLILYSSRPWGFDIDNLRMGTIAAEVHNFSGFASRPSRPRDYFPRFRVRDDRPKDAAYWEEVKDACRDFVKRQQKRHGN